MELKEAIENFRSALYQYVELRHLSVEEDAALSQLVAEYDRCFPKMNSSRIRPQGKSFAELLNKYCYKEHTRCPICGDQLAQRHNRTNGQRFLGCVSYPACKGTRAINGQIIMTRYVRDFLIFKLESERNGSQPSTGRFSIIDMDGT